MRTKAVVTVETAAPGCEGTLIETSHHDQSVTFFLTSCYLRVLRNCIVTNSALIQENWLVHFYMVRTLTYRQVWELELE